ncbi:glutathione S-transferase family protein [Rhizobium sp. SL86]|jgi:glutathione S-transferase|uniref:glutathione S-transferase family protein n=1 Tax=Rhizobium sp. SL86 TaxID=2995148 RepID=UPI0022748C10|nr:glutathione S-transferase [Rhizobium sp. SL86]MCY1668277.1 glutathione S-transferase [Rhizobium sp. SL86]
MIIVHYLNNSRAHRILWLLEELGLAYEVKTYQRGPDMRAPASLKAVHPLGKSPVIEDGGRIIAESGAIIEYLVETYGEGRGLKPAAGTDEALRYRYWLHYAEGSAMPLLLLKLLFLRLPGQLPFFLRPVASMIANGVQGKLVDPQLADHLAFWNSELSRDGWFAGSAFSAADIAMSFPVEAGMTRMKSMGDVSAVRRYLDAIRARPAYQQALEKGGQYDYATS